MESSVAQTLARLQAALDENLSPVSPLVAALQRLRTRLGEGRLQLAVLGQFKRGKSTFLNALLGAPYLPSAVIPVTAIPTFVGWGETLLLRVAYENKEQTEEIAAADADAMQELIRPFVAEEANPENRLRVSRIDAFVPAPILKQGIVLIDTPGVGSTHRHNTDAALRVLPECDAALFVVSVDPPITEGEIEYLQLVKSKAERIFYILNKTDLVDAADLQQALAFMQAALKKHGFIGDDARIFPVSTRNGLNAAQGADRAAFAESGMASVEQHLLRYLATEKMASLEVASVTKAASIAAEAETELTLSLRALELPLETLDGKQRAFEELMRPIEARRLVVRDLLKGERGRIGAALEARAESLREEARRRLHALVDDIADRAYFDQIARLTADRIAPATLAFFDAARDETVPDFTAQTERALAAHDARIGELADSVRRTAADLFELPPPPPGSGEKFRPSLEPYWLSHRWNASLLPDLSPMIDRLLSRRRRRARLEARLKAQIDELVVRNVENLRWSILRGLDDTFGSAAATLEARLDQALALTRAALANAWKLREERADQTEPEIARLHQGIGALREIRSILRT